MAQTNQLNELPHDRFTCYRSDEGGPHIQMTAENPRLKDVRVLLIND